MSESFDFPSDAAHAKTSAKKTPKFYSHVSVEPRDGRFFVLLDNKIVRTPARENLSLPTREAAEQVAQEWREQRDAIDIISMPTVRLVNCAMDGVAKNLVDVCADLVKYAGSDLVCYRAESPKSLIKAQARALDPILEFARDRYGARFVLGEGVMFVEQPHEAIECTARAIDRHAKAPNAALKLAALHSMTTLTGSVLIALAHCAGALGLEEAWAAAHVDEDHQIAAWGRDEEAWAIRALKFKDFVAASHLFRAL